MKFKGSGAFRSKAFFDGPAKESGFWKKSVGIQDLENGGYREGTLKNV